MTDWRSIPAKDVAWSVNPVSRNCGKRVENACEALEVWKGEWREKTLGDIAELGRKIWLRQPNMGPMTADVIEWVIDEAAEGRCPFKNAAGVVASEAYIPKCERIK